MDVHRALGEHGEPPAWANLIWLIVVVQQVVLMLDSIPCAVPIHRVSPCSLWFAYLGAVIEYQGVFLMSCAYVTQMVVTRVANLGNRDLAEGRLAAGRDYAAHQPLRLPDPPCGPRLLEVCRLRGRHRVPALA